MRALPSDAKRYPEAAAYLGISESTLARIVKRRELRVLRLTNRGLSRKGVPVYFLTSDLDAYVMRCANTNRKFPEPQYCI